MKNRRNIIESELPPQNPFDIWMKDGKFYKSTNKGWVLIENQMEFTNSKQMSKSTATSGTIGVNKETGRASIYNDVAEQWSPLGGGVTETTWQELKDKRDNGKLIPGSLYRITDYQCTTTQENTQSAGHQFDIVLLALSEDKLAEEGWAMMNESNVYDVTFENDGISKKCWVYITRNFHGNVVFCDSLLGCEDFICITSNDGDPEQQGALIYDETTKTARVVNQSLSDFEYNCDSNLTYNYFQNSNLSAWKVWYCLDNDKSRFAWAMDIQPASVTMSDGRSEDSFIRTPEGDANNKYCWLRDDQSFAFWTDSDTPQNGDSIYNTNGEIISNCSIVSYTPSQEGRGVIYRLIDEWNNDIKYDFKNIQFNRTITDGQYDENGTETWCYTLNVWYDDMCQDASIVGNTLPNDEGFVNGVYDNKFGYATAYNLYIEGVNTFAFALGNNVVLSVNEGEYYGIYSNVIGNDFYNNTIGNKFQSNTIRNFFGSNTIGIYFNNNTIGNDFISNTIGDNFYSNMIGNNFGNNEIRETFFYNMIGNGFINRQISTALGYANYGNKGVELATKS